MDNVAVITSYLQLLTRNEHLLLHASIQRYDFYSASTNWRWTVLQASGVVLEGTDHRGWVEITMLIPIPWAKEWEVPVSNCGVGGKGSKQIGKLTVRWCVQAWVTIISRSFRGGSIPWALKDRNDPVLPDPVCAHGEAGWWVDWILYHRWAAHWLEKAAVLQVLGVL